MRSITDDYLDSKSSREDAWIRSSSFVNLGENWPFNILWVFLKRCISVHSIGPGAHGNSLIDVEINFSVKVNIKTEILFLGG